MVSIAFEMHFGFATLADMLSVFGQSGAGNNWAKGHYTEGQSGGLHGVILFPISF
jgi:hypothetical protein